ncbi:unnamed protein product [Effrenium voratum]|uniref:Uncharacterized protein n=1 Tax=Effrenium voratum TaxID=2562239 RepID=A0AA36IF74_9DINO|nr:unnamed protein product [Effrenium voratum]
MEELLKRSKSEVVRSVLQEVQGRKGPLPSVVLRVQRLSSGSNAPHSNYAYDLVLPYLAAYTQANQLADISVSADPFVAFPMANLIISKGVKVVRESDEALKKRSHAQVLTLSVRSQTTEEVLASLDSVSGARSKL